MKVNVPLVAVVTPVYNGETFLSECIESVLSQQYKNWQYIIVNNCSTDSTLSIASRYAALDPRISVYSNSDFLNSIENHNHAFRLISPESKYCKVVSADDVIFPDCIEKLVAQAEANPSVGIVNSYQLCGDGRQWQVKWAGMEYPSQVVSGREICRTHLLGSPYVFGSPTSSLYRSDLVRARNSFYPHSLPHADWSVCYECLQNSDFGFVHQVLSFGRIHPRSISSACNRMRTLESAILRNLISYGPLYLTREEYKVRLKQVLDDYYAVLATGLFNRKGKEYWMFHKNDLAEFGYRLFCRRMTIAVCRKLSDLVLNPKQTLEKVFRHIAARPTEEFADEYRSKIAKSGGISVGTK